MQNRLSTKQNMHIMLANLWIRLPDMQFYAMSDLPRPLLPPKLILYRLLGYLWIAMHYVQLY
jgi:hypothetical protein